MARRSILFVHQNFPAQFGALAGFLARQGWQVVYATAAEPLAAPEQIKKALPGVQVLPFKAHRAVSDQQHRYLNGTESAVLNGQAAARLAIGLREKGFQPDVVVAHSGWGSGSFAKVVWPDAKFVQYLEWWYNYPPPDVMKDDLKGSAEDRHAKTLCRNLPFLLDAQTADAIWMPTEFQASQLPEHLCDRLWVAHDGVDPRAFRPAGRDDTPFRHAGLPDDAPIVTYATRGMEPMRGFPQFMAAWAKIQHELPDTHCVIAGTDRISYGARLQGGKGYKKPVLDAHDFDETRLHFVGHLPRSAYIALLQRSDAHVYLTRPFVLSWSMIEAMMVGAPLIVSDTAPVREALPDGGGVFVDMDDIDAIAHQMCQAIQTPGDWTTRRATARSHAQQNYASDITWPEIEEFLTDLIADRGSIPNALSA